MIVTATYNNGDAGAVTGYSVSPTALNTAGTQTITVSYKGKTASFTVEVEAVPVVLNEIVISALPKTGYTVGESLDLTGLVVTAKYSDGGEADVTGAATINPSAGTKLETEGSQTVSVSFEGKTASFTVEVEPAPLSNDATLASLGVSAGTLSPAFNANTTSYAATVPYSVESINITATANDAKAAVSGVGVKALNVGVNNFTVVITAEDGTLRNYTIAVTREPAPLSNDATLANLGVSAGTLSPAFNANTTSYAVTVPYSVESITITATANDAKAAVSGTGVKALNVGVNNFTVVVTAEDGTKKTYTVNVTREQIPQAGTDLELLRRITADLQNAKKGFDDLKYVDLVLEGKTLKLVVGNTEIILATNVNNKNVSGEVDLGNGYRLVYDIKGNGSNVKEFTIIHK
jgi:hypothetical protein